MLLLREGGASVKFESEPAHARVEKLWRLGAQFGMERSAIWSYLNEIVSDRYVLVNGLQVLRDELQFAVPDGTRSDVEACGADFSLPSVVPTVANTNCGDRIHAGATRALYNQVVAARFATLSEIGELKVEAFSPTGGGTDDGATLAHVTLAHQLDESLRRRLYEGNAQSYVLLGIDLMTHVGRLDQDGTTLFGRTRESPWREPRAACGAIAGTLHHFNPKNGVHRRIRRDLGEENFAYLSKNKVLADDGTDITGAVAAGIVAIRGMRSTLDALAREMDERGMAHLTASVMVNRVSENDTILYLARGTVFAGERRIQGLGTHAEKYSGKMVDYKGDKRLVLGYEGMTAKSAEYATFAYVPRQWDPSAAPAHDADADLDDLPIGETIMDGDLPDHASERSDLG